MVIKDNNGFSMIELVFTMLVIGILAVSAASSYTKYLPEKHLKQAATQMFLDMQKAKSKAVVNRQNYCVTFDNTNNQYSIGPENSSAEKTVTLSDFGSGVTFGMGPATVPKPDYSGAEIPDDFISFQNNTVTFRPNGMLSTALGGYVYITNDTGKMCYALAVPRPNGNLRMFKTGMENWPDD